MTEQRKGEIAFAILKASVRSEGFRFDEETTRRLAKLAEDVGVTRAELNEFLKILMAGVVDDIVGK